MLDSADPAFIGNLQYAQGMQCQDRQILPTDPVQPGSVYHENTRASAAMRLYSAVYSIYFILPSLGTPIADHSL
jgi:hypothetical protein